MGYENVGAVWTPASLREYLGTINPPTWCNAITLHHTGAPSLEDRPHGFIAQHLNNLEDYYRNKKGWSAGPHLFVDEDQLWGMCDFRRRGVHAVSFNSRAIGIEVLGDYDTESPQSGRGVACWKTAAAASKVILEWLGVNASAGTVLFHRDDPETSKSCPGDRVRKDWVLGLISDATGAPKETKHAKPQIDVQIPNSEWRFVGEQWCIPVAGYLQRRGVAMPDISANLTSSKGRFYYGGEWLEGAFYDAGSQATWAPVRELTELVSET